MVYTSRERQDEVRMALRTIVSDPEFGVRALSNSRVMSNMLKDLLPDAPAETGVVVAAAEAGLAQSTGALFSLNGLRNSTFDSLDRFWRSLTWG